VHVAYSPTRVYAVDDRVGLKRGVEGAEAVGKTCLRYDAEANEEGRGKTKVADDDDVMLVSLYGKTLFCHVLLDGELGKRRERERDEVNKNTRYHML
jgi:hypothetical protein